MPGEGVAYLYSNVGVELEASAEGVAYDYENVGVFLEAGVEAAAYVYENVGVFLEQEQEGYAYSYFNMGYGIANSGEGYGYVFYGDVNEDTPEPVLWFLLPNFGREGDGFRLYCYGVGEFQATFDGDVELDWGGVTGWQTITVVSWTSIPANGDAYGPDRLFDGATGHIDMEHTIIEAVIPTGTVPPGYLVRIRTDGP